VSVEIVRARGLENLVRLRLGRIADQLDALLSEAALGEPTYLDFLDAILRGGRGEAAEADRDGHHDSPFRTVKTLDKFDFKFQPSVDQKLVRELAVSRYVANAKNVLIFGPPGVGKTHLAIGLGRAALEASYTVLFTSATALLGALSEAETEGQLAERLAFYAKPKLLVVDELGYLPVREAQRAPVLPHAPERSPQPCLPGARHARGSCGQSAATLAWP
jgi:DNA replication protein DnaC